MSGIVKKEKVVKKEKKISSSEFQVMTDRANFTGNEM